MGRRARGRREQKRPTRPKRRLRYLGILAGVAAAAVVVAVVIIISLAPWDSDGGSTPSEVIVPTPRPADIPHQGTTLGNPDAPLTIVEYTDFQCTFCAQMALEILPQVEEEYVATGKAKLVCKHVALLGEESQWAAEAAECANEQDKFWEYYDILFANQTGTHNAGAFSKLRLKAFAEALGLDTSSFNACLDEGKYINEVAANNLEARRRNVNSTPTFFVGQTEIEGAKSYEEFKKAIDDELARLGGTPEAG
jgi:protein-disulfide isomerase